MRPAALMRGPAESYVEGGDCLRRVKGRCEESAQPVSGGRRSSRTQRCDDAVLALQRHGSGWWRWRPFWKPGRVFSRARLVTMLQNACAASSQWRPTEEFSGKRRRLVGVENASEGPLSPWQQMISVR